MSSKKDDQINLYISAITTRDPSKRQIKPVDKDAFQLFEDFESGSDEDFVLDSNEESDDNDDVKGDDSDEDEEDADQNEDKETNNSDSEIEQNSEIRSGVTDLVLTSGDRCLDNELVHVPHIAKCKLDTVMICMMCLMDETYSDNEIIECDGCGIVVHEDCYKICDNVFMSCDASDASTDPWFCDVCLNNVKEPRCELCPVEGGVFKRTENNRWVHLLCALYTPGVAFNDVENLSEVTLSELPLKEWSSKECCLCSDPFYAKTGICISCDAGLCKNYFHVLCAQKEGLLSEPNMEENPDDPYFAQCQQHTDKEVAKRRRKNWNAAINRQKLRIDDWKKNNHFEDARLHRKLEYFSSLYLKFRELAPPPFVPSNKVPCYLETSPAAVYLFRKKANNLRLPQDMLNSHATSDTRTGTGVPVFSPDFITYFLDREKKIDELSLEIVRLESSHRDMQISEQNTSHQFNKVMAKKDAASLEYKDSWERLNVLYFILKSVSVLPEVTEVVARMLSRFPPVAQPVQDAGDNDSNSGNTTTNNGNGNGGPKADSVINECCMCKSVSDQHLMIDCDDCRQFFHLHCLEPPLTRMPRKTKLYGWQCCNCGRVSSDEGTKKVVDVNKPRQLRKVSDVCSRYKRFDNLTNVKNRLLQNSKNIANKRGRKPLFKKPVVSVVKAEDSVKVEEKGPCVAGTSSTDQSDSTSGQRRSHRSKKRPMTLLDEFEAHEPPKRQRLSSKLIVNPQPRRRAARSLPISTKTFHSRRSNSSSLKLEISKKEETKAHLSNEEVDTKPAKQPITFFPSSDKIYSSKHSPESDQVQIGVVAKKPLLTAREGGLGKPKMPEKRPVMIKWFGDQDEARVEKAARLQMSSAEGGLFSL